MKPGTLSLSQAALIALAIWPAFSPVQSFSGDFVFRDLLAQPQYVVKLLDQFLPMSAVDPERLKHGNIHRQQTPLEAPRIETAANEGKKQDEQTQRDSSLVMTSPDGQRWSCVIPPKPTIKVEEPPKKTPQEIADEEQQNIKRGLELLEPIATKGCLFKTVNYWTYEYCHKIHVRQYHVINVDGRLQPDPNAELNVLGTFEEPPGIQGSTGNEATQKSVSRQSGTMTDLVASQDKKYLVQQWENGNHCKLIGKPRRVEIQYQCAPTLSDQIISANEPSTCSYVIVISSPRLCKDAAFQQAQAPEANKIDCRPLVNNEQYNKITSEPGTIDSGDGKGKIVSQNDANKPDELTLLKELESLMSDLDMVKDEKVDQMVVLLQKHQKALEPYMTDAQKAILKKFQDAFNKNTEIKIIGLDRNGQADHDTVVYLRTDSAKAASFVKEQDGENKKEEEEKTFLDFDMEALGEEYTPEQEAAAAKYIDAFLADLDLTSLLKSEGDEAPSEEDKKKKGDE
ncbi:Protein OS-9 [Podila verticillata]|nr:Protein OS-9 [Podila verticillata]KAF9385191.1 Protein OS-9 [Podila verticillata]